METTNKKPAILCMFSGGIDSTGALHHLLTEDQFSDHILVVHHIHIYNRENRAKAEAQAVKQIIDYYKKNSNRKFLVTESTFDSTGFAPLMATRFPYDMDVCAFYGANVTVARKEIQLVAWGRTKTDTSGGGNFEARMQRMQDVFDSVWILEKEPVPKFIFPVIELSKKEIWNMLPEKVRKMTWCCRTPIYDSDKAIPCQKCGTCLEVKDFINE